MAKARPCRCCASGLTKSAFEAERGRSKLYKGLIESLKGFAISEWHRALMTIAMLHDKARRAVDAGEHKFREAAECLAAARKLGATQRQSAKAINKSAGWVNGLLRWRKAGYKGTPFGPQSKAQRARVQSVKQSRRPMTTEEALAMRARAEAVTAMFGVGTKRIPAAARAELLKALRMLSSDHAAERASAALIAERQRARLNLTWDDLLVPAEVDENKSTLRVATAA
jgi:hypothetical protein